MGLFRDTPARGYPALPYDRNPRASRRGRLLEHRVPRLRRRLGAVAPAVRRLLPGFWQPASPEPALPAGRAPFAVRSPATEHRLIFAVCRRWVRRRAAGTIRAQQRRLISAQFLWACVWTHCTDSPASDPAPFAHAARIFVSPSHRTCVSSSFLFFDTGPRLCSQPQLSPFQISPPLSRCIDMQSFSS